LKKLPITVKKFSAHQSYHESALPAMVAVVVRVECLLLADLYGFEQHIVPAQQTCESDDDLMMHTTPKSRKQETAQLIVK